MTNNHRSHWTYADASDYLGDKDERPAPFGGRTTRIKRSEDSIELRHHDRVIIEWMPDGSIYLDIYPSVTSRHRINNYTPEGINVFQKDFEQYLVMNHDWDTPIPREPFGFILEWRNGKWVNGNWAIVDIKVK